MVKKWRQNWYTKGMTWHKWFLPHPDTHKKAHLISWQAILVYILLFGALQLSFKFIESHHPGVLGIASNVNQQKLIELTNTQRQKLGLGTLSENSALDQAAAAKAANMFAENYWAHYSPSGKDPWGFMTGAGYKFSVAGENLAKNFQNSDDVVVAWMNSPSHRDNIVNSKYKEIGIAVANGVINGEETTLVVQMFGTPTSGFATAAAPAQAEIAAVATTPAPIKETIAPSNISTSSPVPTTEPTSSPIVAGATPVSFVASSQTTNFQPLINPFKVSQSFALTIISLIFVLLLVDLYVLRRRGVFRITSHHIAHLSILGALGGLVVNSHSGNITPVAAAVVTNFLR
jgi:hypothetical protein